jgi:hypothetical protein
MNRIVPLLLLCFLWDSPRSRAQEDPQPDDPYARQTVVGYASVREAFEDLKAKPDVTIVTRRDGWVVVTEPRPYAQWSFTPEGHYAHPAVVRRTIQQSPNGEVRVETAALCGAEQAACEKLMAEFRQRN